MRKKTGTMTISENVDVDINICIDDIIDFIKDYATDSDLKSISDLVRGVEHKTLKTLVDIMKYQLMIKAMDKYSLEELESRLEMDYL